MILNDRWFYRRVIPFEFAFGFFFFVAGLLRHDLAMWIFGLLTMLAMVGLFIEKRWVFKK